MKKAILVIALTLVILVFAGSTPGCTQKTASLTGTWEIGCVGAFDIETNNNGTLEEEFTNGTFGREFTITVKQENTTLQGTEKVATEGRPYDWVGEVVILNGEVKDGSKVTFTIHEDLSTWFPTSGYVDLIQNFTGTVLDGKITGTFQGGVDIDGNEYRVDGEFTVSIDPASSVATPPATVNTPPDEIKTIEMEFPIMDLRGTWSGTQIITTSVPNKYYDTNTYHLVITIKEQHEDEVIGQFTATGISYYRDGILQPSCGAYGWPRKGEIFETHVTWLDPAEIFGDNSKGPGERLRVSGNSMTGKGAYTVLDGTIHTWSYNLTRVH